MTRRARQAQQAENADGKSSLPLFLRVAKFSELTSVPEKTVYDWASNGTIKAVKMTPDGPKPATECRGIRGPILIPSYEIDALMETAVSSK